MRFGQTLFRFGEFKRHRNSKPSYPGGVCPIGLRSEALADHLLALGPERLGALRIEGVGAYAFADRAGCLAFQDVGRLRAAVAHDGAVAGNEVRKIAAIEETRA